MPLDFRRELLKLYQSMTGSQVLIYFDELSRTQWFSRDELLALQQVKLQQLVAYAYQYVPYYRRTFDEVGFHPEDLRRDPASFQKISLVTKEYMRDHLDEFITTDPAVRRTLKPCSTSGSTGEPFTFWEDKRYRERFAAIFLGYLTWSGWKFGEPYVLFLGRNQSQKGSLLLRLRNSLRDFLYNSLIADAYILSEEKLEALIRRIRRHQPRLLFSYPSTLFALAQFVRQRQFDDIKFYAVYSNGEMLYPDQRGFIEATFSCKVFNRYGALECRGIACECETHTGMHISLENCYVEVLRDNKLVEDEQPGEIVVTNLNNYGFPFIRYQVKDVVQRLNQVCPCGRQSPMLASVRGRTGDMFRTITGKTIWSDVFEIEKFKGIKQYQFIQRSLDLILVRIVRDDTFQEASVQLIEDKIKKEMGNETRVQFEFPDHIPVSKSGKYRYSYSELNVSQLTKHG